MQILLNWLRDYVDIYEGVKEIAFKLTMSGFEVEEVVDLKEQFKNCKVAYVNKTENHPKADKLKICEVSTGTEILKVVCGAPNVSAGQKVIIALPGARLPSGNIDKTVIRDVESFGMLCSEKDLGFTALSTGIIVLPENISIGKDIWEEAYRDLDDYVLSINITPNRGDCLSHLGIARELSALTNRPLKKRDLSFQLVDKADFIDIDIESPDLCPRYTAMLIKDVKIKDSPDYLKIRLFACGMRSINNIVDITNFVMLDRGQPLHAFDYDLIRDKKIIVRKAFEGERIVTLDGKERTLKESDLVIADTGGAIAIAGVMGGLNSEVTEKTKNILLESAYFNPPSIRKTAKRLSLPSEASYRFERGIDMLGVPESAILSASMMGKLAEGIFQPVILDAYPKPYHKEGIKFLPDRCAMYLGNKEIMNKAEDRLKALGFSVIKKRFEWDVTVPSYRQDVTIEEDLYEEIARLGYYEEIFPLLPEVKIKSRKIGDRDFLDSLKCKIVDFGGYEVINYSFVTLKELKKSLTYDRYKDRLIFIKNPLTDDETVMRPNSVSSMLNVLELNHKRSNYDLFLYEIGKAYRLAEDNQNNKKIEEKKIVSFAFSGNLWEKSWFSKEEPYDFFNVKGIVEGIIEATINIPISVNVCAEDKYPFLNPAVSAEIIIDGKPAGFFGLVHPDVIENYEIKRDVFIAELDYFYLKNLYFAKRTYYYGFSRYPKVDRDITVIVNEDLPVADIQKIIFSSGAEFLENIRLVDLFRGEKIGTDKKSLTFKLIFQSMEKTLNDEEVNKETQKIADNLLKKLKVEFPK
ncbi:MAG: phenylalanine--tRNA ligase subunit beta [Proteobacteria bacterium]|nr:phenylalanine--tRNA ligase subunit beta [Pseudomonadota bacterium]